MLAKHYSSEAIVLKRSNFSEADRMLVVYSKHYGKISLLAKGVRKPKSKKRASVEVFSKIKFSAVKGKNIDIVTETELLDPQTEVRKSLARSALCYYFVEVVRRITQEEDKNEDLYKFLVESIEKLKSENKLRIIKEQFVYNVLVIMGFWPHGKKNSDPELVLEEVIERELSSKRVGKKLLN